MKMIIKRLLCKHDYRLKFTCEVTSEEGNTRIKYQECIKCKKKIKRYI